MHTTLFLAFTLAFQDTPPPPSPTFTLAFQGTPRSHLARVQSAPVSPTLTHVHKHRSFSALTNADSCMCRNAIAIFFYKHLILNNNFFDPTFPPEATLSQFRVYVAYSNGNFATYYTIY